MKLFERFSWNGESYGAEAFDYLPTAMHERVHSNIVTYKDQVLAAGGCESLDTCFNTVEAFDWASQTWEEKAAVPLPG